MSLYLDKNLTFSDKQAITSTTESENAIDFGKGCKCSAAGRLIEFRASEEFAGGTGITFILQDSEDGSSYTDKVTSVEIPLAALNEKTGNAIATIAIPKGLRRFIRIKYNVNGSFSKGKITSMITAETN